MTLPQTKARLFTACQKELFFARECNKGDFPIITVGTYWHYSAAASLLGRTGCRLSWSENLSHRRYVGPQSLAEACGFTLQVSSYSLEGLAGRSRTTSAVDGVVLMCNGFPPQAHDSNGEPTCIRWSLYSMGFW